MFNLEFSIILQGAKCNINIALAKQVGRVRLDFALLVCLGGVLSWKAFWKFANTDSRACPEGTEAAFSIFHYTGMWGTSEAAAEGVASVLRRYSDTANGRISTGRIIQKTLLNRAGVSGSSADDAFIQLCWAA